MNLQRLSERLDHFHRQITTVILSRQHPVSGLLPASTAVTTHGDYTDAWVRDNVYSVLAVWGLALAYRRVDEADGRTYRLEQSTVKLMRGLLLAMMRQSAKVERFKDRQDPLSALHAKYDTATGNPVVGDDEWGHLQLDATSVYLLMLAQMTASGLQIVFTEDEVAFVQNLVYYIGRAYRTPDYGIWERGNKINHGKPELNASSVGMAKAALEAIQGINLFGVRGGPSSVIQVLPDEIARARITLESLLPRESGSKEVDAALLSIVGYPAFAVDDPEIREATRGKIVAKLQGHYGCKRFLRDGHQTVIEDTSRLHYEPEELRQFEHIECEWPLFFAYQWLDALFCGDAEAIDFFAERLAAVAVERDGVGLLPEVYYVPEAALAAEREAPGSQERLPNDNVPLVWAQSLYYLGQLLREGLLRPGDLDPLGRHLESREHRFPIVQVALLAEDEALRDELFSYGIRSEVPADLAPLQVHAAGALSRVLAELGRCPALGLSGRPVRRLRSLTTSRIFRIGGELMVFLPSFLDRRSFYLALDDHFLVAQLKSELAYIHDHWREPGRPTVTLLLTHDMFQLDRNPIHESPLLALVNDLLEGHAGPVPVQVGPLNQLALTSPCDRIDRPFELDAGLRAESYSPGDSHQLTFDPGGTGPLTSAQESELERETDEDALLERLRGSDNLFEQVELLSTLKNLKGLAFDTGLGEGGDPVSVGTLLEEIYAKAARTRRWALLRRASELLGKADITLSDAVTELIVRQKRIAVGKAYSEDSVISEPMAHKEILEKIWTYSGNDARVHVLTQELLINLSVLIKAEPQLFDDLMTLRVGRLILLLTNELAREESLSQVEAYDRLLASSPFALQQRLRRVLAGYRGLDESAFDGESLHARGREDVTWAVVPAATDDGQPEQGDWWRKRQIDGEINRVPEDFYSRVWSLLHHCEGIVIGSRFERRNRLESTRALSESTPGEHNFAATVDHLLSRIRAPEYRHLTIEALQELAEIFSVNPELAFDDFIAIDVLVGHAVRLHWFDRHPDRRDRYEDDKVPAWRRFYEAPPSEVARYIGLALEFLSRLGEGELEATEVIPE